MASVSFYSQLTARNKAIGGLASGLDTDSLVEALTTTTRSKLAKQTQQKTLINWKVSAYRGVRNTLYAFQSKHLSLSAGTSSLKTSAFFNSYKGTSSSDKITVKPSTGAQTGSIKIQQVNQLATAQTFTTSAFSNPLDGNTVTAADLTNQDWVGKTLTVALDGTSKTIKLDTLQGLGADAATTELQRLVTAAFGTKSDGTNVINVTNKASGTGDLQLNLDSATSTVAVRSTCEGLGLDPKMTNRLSTTTKLSELFSDLEGDTFRFKINDTTISVNKDDTLSTFMSKINNSTAGVRVTFSSISQSFVFTSKTTGGGDNLRMQDVQGNLLSEFVGAQGGNAFESSVAYTDASQGGNALNLSSLFADPGNIEDDELTKLKNTTFQLKVGTTSLTLNCDLTSYKDQIESGMDAREALLARLNEQIEAKFGEDSGMTFHFSDVLSDGTTPDPASAIQFTSTVRDKQTTLTAGTDNGTDKFNALDLLGMDAKTNTTFTLGYEETAQGSALNIAGLFNDGAGNFGTIQPGTYKMDMTVNGVTKTLSVTFTQAELDKLKQAQTVGSGENERLETPEEMQKRRENAIVNKLNAAKRVAFGNKTGADDTKVSFSIKDDKLTLTSNSTDFAYSLGATPADKLDGATDLLSPLGATGMSNAAANQGTTLASIGITNGTVTVKLGDGQLKTIDIDANTTIQDFMKKINTEVGRDIVSFSGGKLTIDGGTQALEFHDTVNGDVPPKKTNAMEVLFGQSDWASAPAATGKGTTVMGQNAEIVVDGKTVVSTTNSFTINGVEFEVNSEYNKEGATDVDPITLNVTYDTDDVVDKIKNFIDEYNVLVDALNGLVKESKTDGYEPLTDEQKAEMTDDQIKSWESEAKKGLLRNDQTLRNILTQLRGSLYTKVEAAGISLFDIGITTESYSTSSSSSSNGRLEMTEAGEAKLRSMLEQNPDAVRELFTDSEQGLAVQMDKIIDDAVRTSSTNQGSLVAIAGTETTTGNNSSTLSRKLENIEKQITLLQTRLETEYNRYWKQFSALETAISNMNSQSSWLSSFGS